MRKLHCSARAPTQKSATMFAAGAGHDLIAQFDAESQKANSDAQTHTTTAC